MKSQIQPSLYIKTENQELLWEMLNKTPQISQVFDSNSNSSSQIQKESWFRGIIANFHNKTPIVQNREELLKMNRQTLSYMINQLNNNIQQIQQIQQKQQKQQSLVPTTNTPSNQRVINDSVGNGLNIGTTTVGTVYSRNMQTENREDTYKRQFEEREREYKSMSAPPELPKVNFALSEDTAIANMAELVEQHRKIRELDIQPTTPIPTTQIPQTQNSIQQTDGSPIKLKLEEELPKEIIESIELQDVSSSKRKVTWEDEDTLYSSLKSLKKDIAELKTQMKDLKEVLSTFFDKLSTKEIVETLENIDT